MATVDYGAFLAANKPFATLGEIAAQKDEQALKQLQTAVTVSNLRRQQEESTAKAEATRKAAQRQELVQEAVQQFSRPDGTYDKKAVIAFVRPRDTEAADALEADWTKQQEAAAKAKKGDLDNQEQQWKLTAQFLQGAKEKPQLYPAIWSRIKAYDPEMADFLGPQPDTAKIDTAIAAGTSRSDYNRAYKDILDEKTSNTDKSLKILALAKDPEHWQDGIDFADLHGVKDELAAMGVSQFTPDAPQQIANYLMGPGKVADLAEQKADNERQAAEFAQSNAVARGNLAVSQGNLSVAQGNLKARQDEAKAGASGAGGAKLSAAAVEKVAGVDQSLSMISDIDRMLPNMAGYIGILDGRMARAKLATGKGVTPQLAEFDAQITGLKNAVIKATTGAAMSEPEAKRIMGQLPDLNLPEAVFKARLATTKRNLEMLKKRTIELSGGTVDTPPTGASTKIGRFEVSVE